MHPSGHWLQLRGRWQSGASQQGTPERRFDRWHRSNLSNPFGRDLRGSGHRSCSDIHKYIFPRSTRRLAEEDIPKCFWGTAVVIPWVVQPADLSLVRSLPSTVVFWKWSQPSTPARQPLRTASYAPGSFGASVCLLPDFGLIPRLACCD